LRIWCGIDWSERHHDVALVDDEGALVAKRRIPESAAGFGQLLELLAEHGGRSDAPIPVAIETAKGLLPVALQAAGYRLFPINPLAVSRYRDRYAVSRAKSDPGDALVLANILRTDLAAHRPVPDDSELAATIRVLARAQQDAVWDRQQIVNKLRSLLREYHPAMPATFDDLASCDARAALHVAPTPAAAHKLRRASLRAALVRGGRRRNIDRQVDRILAGIRAEQFRHPELVEQAMGQAALAHLRALDTAVANIAELEHALGEAFAQHPDAAILTSFPGLGIVLGARILGEMGDDRSRFADAKAFKAFAGTAPVTRASGKKTSVTRRVVRNRRLCQAGYLWALPLLTHSPGARAHYDHRRERGDSYNAAAPVTWPPLLRDPVPLPATPPQLRRSQGLPDPNQDRGLTATGRAMSVRPWA
jgi:transposase